MQPTFVCLLCDWIGAPTPVWAHDGSIELLHLQLGGVKPLRYEVEIVMNGTDFVRMGNFETKHQAAGMAIWAHFQGPDRVRATALQSTHRSASKLTEFTINEVSGQPGAVHFVALAQLAE
jgi:hypothetical protein